MRRDFSQTLFGNLSSQTEPASQSCSYTSLLHAHLPSDWDQCFASTGVVRLLYRLQDTVLGICSLYLYFHYRRTWAGQHLCKCSLVLTAEGLCRLSVHPHLSWISLSLQHYVTIPSISFQDLVCHQYVSLKGCEPPASSLLYSLTLPHLSRQSHKSSLLLLQTAPL